MVRSRKLRALAAGAGVAALMIGCGGGGGGSVETPAATTTDVPVTVIDGAIEGATVCLDKNNNGACDTGEPTGTTNAAGKVTLKVDNADVGKFVVLAVVGTTAKDADTGPVTTAFTMSTPADRSAVVSPLTTLVHTAMADSGLSSAEAEAVVRSQSGLEVSLFNDFTTGTDAGNTAAGSLARLVVLVTQEQNAALGAIVGQSAADGTAITAQNVETAVRKNLLQTLANIAEAATQPEVLAAFGPARDTLLRPRASTLVAASGLTATTLPTVVAVNNQLDAPATPVAHVPTGGYTLGTLDYTDASNHFLRFLTSSLAQDTPDANGRLRYQDRRFRTVNGVQAVWAVGSTPSRQADLNWNGSAWVSCPLNFAHSSLVRDAEGRGGYFFCDGRETGTTKRATLDIGGKTMKEVYDQFRAGGYTSLHIADTSVLGSATFPTGSRAIYQTNTVTMAAPTYYPGRAALPGIGNTAAFGNGNTVNLAGVAVGAGGDARGGGTPACSTSGVTQAEVSTLEAMVAQAQGSPCIYNQQSFTYGGQTYTSDVPSTAWGNTTVSLGTIGTAPFGSGPAPGYYTTNTRLRVAFKGSGANATTYYSCKERFNDGSTRQCVEISTGSYSIEQLGDARVMRFNNLPPQASALTYTRAFVERGGAIYFGYQNKLGNVAVARLNQTAAGALLSQLGLPAPETTQPLALTAASYQGTWDIWNPAGNRSEGIALLIPASGSVLCGDIGSTAAPSSACSLTISDPATGAFVLSTSGGETLTGAMDFLAGAVSGSFNDPSASPSMGSITGTRR